MSRPRFSALVLLAFAVLAASPGRHASADPDLDRLLAAMTQQKDAAERLRQIPRLGASTSVVAGRALGDRVRSDPDVRVRIAAAEALGVSRAPNATDVLLERARAGGSRGVRQAVATALARRADGAAAILRCLHDERILEAERVLLVQALEPFRDDPTRIALLTWCAASDVAVREAAMRTLARRTDDPEGRRRAMVDLLGRARDSEAALLAMDALEPAAHPDLEPPVRRLATWLEPEVVEAATHFLARIRAATPAVLKPGAPGAGAPAAPGDAYAPPRPQGEDRPPSEPVPTDVPWPRQDLVYVVDATGSTMATLPVVKKRILDEAALLVRLGGSHRFGVLAYRDGPVNPEAPRPLEVLPPTASLARLEAFLEGVRARGVDERGAAVAGALREALDRTPWRWDARREVHVFADVKAEDAREAVDVAGLHFRADGTRTRVTYMLRTRTAVPAEYADIARAGGTGDVEEVR